MHKKTFDFDRAITDYSQRLSMKSPAAQVVCHPAGKRKSIKQLTTTNRKEKVRAAIKRALGRLESGEIVATLGSKDKKDQKVDRKSSRLDAALLLPVLSPDAMQLRSKALKKFNKSTMLLSSNISRSQDLLESHPF